MQCRTARIFLDFARFPWGYAIQTSDGFDVTFRDLRFFSLESTRGGFVVDIRLDKTLRVRSERFRFSEGPEEDATQGERGGGEDTSGRVSADIRLARSR